MMSYSFDESGDRMKRKQKKDWHSADVIAHLHKKGISLSGLSRQSGLGTSTLSNTLSRPWPKGEWLIAEALGIHPSEIWPSRYFDTEGKLIERQPRSRTRASVPNE